MSRYGRFFIVSAVVAGVLFQVGAAGATHKVKSASGYLLGAVGRGAEGELSCQEDNWHPTGYPVLCFQMPKGAYSYKLQYSWEYCSYHQDLLRPTGQYSGDCISSRKVGRTVRVWAESSTQPWGKKVKIVWSHKRPKKSSGGWKWWGF